MCCARHLSQVIPRLGEPVRLCPPGIRVDCCPTHHLPLIPNPSRSYYLLPFESCPCHHFPLLGLLMMGFLPAWYWGPFPSPMCQGLPLPIIWDPIDRHPLLPWQGIVCGRLWPILPFPRPPFTRAPRSPAVYCVPWRSLPFLCQEGYFWGRGERRAPPLPSWWGHQYARAPPSFEEFGASAYGLGGDLALASSPF